MPRTSSASPAVARATDRARLAARRPRLGRRGSGVGSGCGQSSGGPTLALPARTDTRGSSSVEAITRATPANVDVRLRPGGGLVNPSRLARGTGLGTAHDEVLGDVRPVGVPVGPEASSSPRRPISNPSASLSPADPPSAELAPAIAVPFGARRRPPPGVVPVSLLGRRRSRPPPNRPSLRPGGATLARRVITAPTSSGARLARPSFPVAGRLVLRWNDGDADVVCPWRTAVCGREPAACTTSTSSASLRTREPRRPSARSRRGSRARVRSSGFTKSDLDDDPSRISTSQRAMRSARWLSCRTTATGSTRCAPADGGANLHRPSGAGDASTPRRRAAARDDGGARRQRGVHRRRRGTVLPDGGLCSTRPVEVADEDSSTRRSATSTRSSSAAVVADREHRTEPGCAAGWPRSTPDLDPERLAVGKPQRGFAFSRVAGRAPGSRSASAGPGCRRSPRPHPPLDRRWHERPASPPPIDDGLDWAVPPARRCRAWTSRAGRIAAFRPARGRLLRPLPVSTSSSSSRPVCSTGGAAARGRTLARRRLRPGAAVSGGGRVGPDGRAVGIDAALSMVERAGTPRGGSAAGQRRSWGRRHAAARGPGVRRRGPSLVLFFLSDPAQALRVARVLRASRRTARHSTFGPGTRARASSSGARALHPSAMKDSARRARPRRSPPRRRRRGPRRRGAGSPTLRTHLALPGAVRRRRAVVHAFSWSTGQRGMWLSPSPRRSATTCAEAFRRFASTPGPTAPLHHRHPLHASPSRPDPSTLTTAPDTAILAPCTRS